MAFGEINMLTSSRGTSAWLSLAQSGSETCSPCLIRKLHETSGFPTSKSFLEEKHKVWLMVEPALRNMKVILHPRKMNVEHFWTTKQDRFSKRKKCVTDHSTARAHRILFQRTASNHFLRFAGCFTPVGWIHEPISPF